MNSFNLYKLFSRAQTEGFALGAFNFSNLETLKAIVQAAKKLNTPVVVEVSPREAEFIGLPQVYALVSSYRKSLDLPIFLNLDHGFEEEKVKEAIELGFDMVHFDGSQLSFEENIRISRDLVQYAHQEKVLVEGEIDKIVGSSIIHKERQAPLKMTDPSQAARFVRATEVDVFAAFVGNFHGVYSDPLKLDLFRLEEVRKKTGCFLSLHGGSGIEPEQIKEAIKQGVVKINVNTELRVAYMKTLREVLQAESEEIVPYKIFPPVIEAVQNVVEEKIRLFIPEGKFS